MRTALLEREPPATTALQPRPLRLKSTIRIFDVAVVGAGLAGLAAAEVLASAGRTVLLLEASDRVGGRLSSRRVGGALLDEGARLLLRQSSTLQNRLAAIGADAALSALSGSVRHFSAEGSILPKDTALPRCLTASEGMQLVAEELERALPRDCVTLRLSSPVERLEEGMSGVALFGLAGTLLAVARSVILATPPPVSADLLGESAVSLPYSLEALDRVRSIRGLEFDPAICVLLVYSPPAPPAPCYILQAASPDCVLSAIAFEQLKGPKRAPHGQAALVVQFGPLYSKLCMSEDEPLVIGRALSELAALFGDVYDSPSAACIKRWPHGRTRGALPLEAANPPDIISSVLVCGEGIGGPGGTADQAYSSGLEVAKLLLSGLAEGESSLE